MNFGQKVKKMGLISSDDFLFFGEQHDYRINHQYSVTIFRLDHLLLN